MTGLWREEGFGSAALDPEGLQAVTPSTGEVLGASFAEGFAQNIGVRGFRWAADRLRSLASDQPDLTPDEANREYGIPGVLSFDRPIAETVAARLHEARRVQQLRADTVERGAGGFLMGAGSMAAGFAAGLLDPVNVAAAFIPVVGEARAATLLARAGTSGVARAATRAGIGAVEGSVGMAALQPFDAALSRYEDQDYTMGTALRNIAFGGLLGGVLHPAAGYIGDALKAGPRNPAALTALAAGHDAREAALRAGIAQHVDGQPVNVAPILDTAALGSAFSARNAARGETGLGNYAAYTPDNLRIELRPEVVELSDLIASNLDDGRINPAFTAAGGLQPRDRTSMPSQAQITEIASRLEPERLQPSTEVGAGAPIVNSQGAVESGNGRVMALGKVYTDPRLADQAAAYRAMIAARGHDIEGMRQPVLIGRRINELTPEQTERLAGGGNERTTLGMNEAEQARSDAARVARAIDAWRPGGIAGPANRRFVAEFMAHMPTAEGGAMKRTNGDLSGAGIARIRGAMLAHAYGDALGPALETMLNGDVGHMKGIAGALDDVAGAWGRMRSMAAHGEIPAGLDITPAIGEAVQLLDRARATGIPIAELLANANMFDGPSPAAVGLLRLMFHDDAMRRPVARARLAELLARYTEQAEPVPVAGGVLGGAETTPADILRAIAGTDQRIADAADALVDLARPGGNPMPDEVAGSRQAATLAQQAADDHVGTGPVATPRETTEPASGPENAPTAQTPVTLSPELVEATRAADAEVARVRAEIAAGRLSEADIAELRAADAGVQQAHGDANAYQQAAACLFGNLP